MATITERKNSKGEKTFQVKIRIKGRPTVSKTFNRKTDAGEWAKQTETDLKRGLYFKSIESQKHTFADLIDRFITVVLPKKSDSYKRTERQLLWWKNQLGSYYLCDITPQIISEKRELLQQETSTYKTDENGNKIPKIRSNATVNRYMASLSIAFTYAVNEWCWLDDNPIRKVKKKQETRGRIRFLTEDEKKVLLIACKNSPNKYVYIVVLIALFTGGRYSEILNLKWENINFEKKVIYYMDTKNGENRAVYIAKPLYELLKEHSKIRRINTPFLFPRADGKQPQDIRKSWEKALTASGLEDFRFHDLRHTAASYLAMNGATLIELSQILGHKTLQMVKRYSHLTENHISTVMEKMSENCLVNVI